MASSVLLEIARRAEVNSEAEVRAKRGLSQRSATRRYMIDRQPPPQDRREETAQPGSLMREWSMPNPRTSGHATRRREVQAYLPYTDSMKVHDEGVVAPVDIGNGGCADYIERSPSLSEEATAIRIKGAKYEQLAQAGYGEAIVAKIHQCVCALKVREQLLEFYDRAHSVSDLKRNCNDPSFHCVSCCRMACPRRLANCLEPMKLV